jgi:hypothetical protein
LLPYPFQHILHAGHGQEIVFGEALLAEAKWQLAPHKRSNISEQNKNKQVAT